MILPNEQLRRQLQQTLAVTYPEVGPIPVMIDRTADPKHGDYTSTVAMKLAPVLKQPPREVAQHLLAKFGQLPMLERADVVGPGYINFFLKPRWLLQQAQKISSDRWFGKNNEGKNQRVIVEFVSANPTGPITFGNGRAAFRGDLLSNVLTDCGWQVTREYYINDWGNQVNILAESVLRRYWQQHGIPTDYPDYCYQGEYISDIAKKLKISNLKIANLPDIRDRIKGKILELMIKDHQRVMKKVGITYDSWFRESKLHASQTDQKTLQVLDDHALLYEQDGATWFKSTAFGDDKDRVLVKKDGEFTYLVADLALRWNRFVERKFDREILFLGADHHGYLNRLEAVAAALGFARRITVLIHQLVRLMKDGQEVKISKRAGTFVTLEEVVDEVGPDATRFFFLMHSADTHMDFDLNLAKDQSEKNPVYYVQYAHARISSILKKIKRLPVTAAKTEPHQAELALAKQLLHFPNVVQEVGQTFETHKLPHYATELAASFHDFYTQCRVIDNGTVAQERLMMVQTTQTILAKTLSLMGISAPQKM